MEPKVMPAGYDWSKAAPIKQEFGPLPKEPFQPLGHGPTVRLKAPEWEDYLAVSGKDGKLFASFDTDGNLTGGILRDLANGTGPTFQRNPYLATNPDACVNHEMAWHWRKLINCEQFEAELDHSVGFFDPSDEAVLESRRFRIARDEKVADLARERKDAERSAKGWKFTAIYSLSLGAAALITNVGRTAGWW
jgi:hypothetical protein